MGAKKAHLSASQVDMFCRCPEAYRRRYIEGEIIPPGFAMLKGTGVHAGAEENFRQKISSHEDLPIVDIVDAAVAGFEGAVAGGYAMTEDEESRGSKTVIEEVVADVVEMATLHGEEQAPDYQPVQVEEYVRIELPNHSRDIVGVIDLVDDQDRVVDFKTAGKKKSQGAADNSTQLTIYAAAHKSATGRDASEVRLDTVVRTKTKTSRSVVTSTRDDADFGALANRINAVTGSIDAGTFTPAVPGSWWCGPKWCGYWDTCPFVNSERKEKSK